MSIEDTPEFQRRLADARARTVDAIADEADRLLRDDPDLTPREATLRASQIVQAGNQRRRSLWNPLSWF